MSSGGQGGFGGYGGPPGGHGAQPFPPGGYGAQPAPPGGGFGAQPVPPGGGFGQPGGGFGGQPFQPGGGFGGQPGGGFGGQPGGGFGGGHGGSMPCYPAPVQPHPPAPVFNSGVCKVTSAVDGNVLDAEGGAKKGSGTRIIMWHYEGTQNQKFSIQVEGTGYRITSLVRGKGDKLLALDDASHENKKDTYIILYDFHGQANQQWFPVPVQAFGAHDYVLIKHGRTGRCLRNMGHGLPIQTYPEAHEDKGQWWKVVPV